MLPFPLLLAYTSSMLKSPSKTKQGRKDDFSFHPRQSPQQQDKDVFTLGHQGSRTFKKTQLPVLSALMLTFHKYNFIYLFFKCLAIISHSATSIFHIPDDPAPCTSYSSSQMDKRTSFMSSLPCLCHYILHFRTMQLQ